MICDNLNSAVISNICDYTPVFAVDKNGTDMDYILQDSEISCITNNLTSTNINVDRPLN